MAGVVKAGSDDHAAVAMTALRLRDLACESGGELLDIRQQAARLLADARREAEAIQLKAEEVGYAAGFERGRQQGYAAGEKHAHAEVSEGLTCETDKLVQLAGDIVAKLARSRDDSGQRISGEVLRLAVALAERIVGHVAASDPGAARHNLVKALALAGEASRKITVLVNPAQHSDLAAQCGELVETLTRCDDVSIVADKHVSPGGVKVITGDGQIDATIETQLDTVAEALLGPRRHGRVKLAAAQTLHDCGSYHSEVSHRRPTDRVGAAKGGHAPV